MTNTTKRPTRMLLSLVLLAALGGPAAAQNEAPAPVAAPAPAPAPAAEAPAAAAPALAAAAPVASADRAKNPLGGARLEKYMLDREAGEIPVEAGRRFLDDLSALSPQVRASVTDAVRFEIQKDEADKFARQKNYVLYAYSALWVILLLFVVGVFSRQRKLAAELAALESRVSREKK